MVSEKLPFGVPEIAPLSIARMISKHKFAVVLVWLGLSAITATVVMRLPPVYKAEALILVDQQKIPEKYVSSTVNTDLQDRLESIRQQILSETRLKPLIQELKLYQDKNRPDEETIEMMRNDIKITLEKGWNANRPGAFRVSYQGPVPTTVAEVATRLANSFRDENLKLRESQSADTRNFMSAQLLEAKQELDKLELAISKFKTEHNGELPQQELSLNNVLSRLQTEMEGNQESIGRAQQTKVVLENDLNLAEAAESAAAKQLADQSNAATAAAAAPVRKQSDVLQEKLDDMRLRYSEDYPDVKRLKDELARVKAEEAKTGPASTRVSNAAAAARRQSAQELTQAKERVSTLRARLKTVNEELDNRAAENKRILEDKKKYEARLDRVPLREQEMEGLTRDYENAKARYRTLLDKKDTADMANRMELEQKSERFEIIDQPTVPEKPFSPNRPFWITLGCGLSLVAGMAFAIGREIKTNCFLGEWELPEGVVTIGRVPFIDFSEDGGIGDASGKRSKRRLAAVSTAVVALMGVIAAGAILAWKHF